MPLKFREIIAQKLQRKKHQLDLAPDNGTVQNYLIRYGIFSAGLKILNKELFEEVNKFIKKNSKEDSAQLTLKNELESIANEAIHSYIKHFKRRN